MNLRVMVPPSRLALIIRAWLLLQGIFKRFEFCGCWLRRRGSLWLSGLGLYYRGSLKVLSLRVLAPLSRLALIIGAWFVVHAGDF